jgi:restriction system protein
MSYFFSWFYSYFLSRNPRLFNFFDKVRDRFYPQKPSEIDMFAEEIKAFNARQKEDRLKDERRELVRFEIAEEMILAVTSPHIDTLARKRKQLRILDDYGNVDESKWRKEIFYFFDKSSLAGKTFLNDEQIYKIIDQRVAEHAELESRSYEEELDPIEYENYCADLLRQNGWDARMTQATGDQGVDVIATKKGRVFAVQCKKYSTAVGNKAVQEVYAGMQYIGAHFCAVVTNAGYTRSAKQLAQTLGVLLLHHDDLKFLDENGIVNC